MSPIRSLAIAGAWGYIGRKFIDAGLDLGLDLHVLDPGPATADLDLGRVHRLDDTDGYCRQPADLYHLALHPEHRSEILGGLLQRASFEVLAILDEKPMAAPGRPQDCQRLIDAVDGTRAILLFDFPELFDPVTARILEFLAGFDEAHIDTIAIQRSKDREDPANPRNRKRMVHIQYQEAVHCLAWVLFLLGHLHAGADDALAGGVSIEGDAEPYAAPNPEDYPYVVDGRVEYDLTLAGTQVRGCTDFKRGAEWAKRRRVEGHGDGRAFVIEVDYLEGAKSLRFDGRVQDVDPEGSSYTGVLTTFDRWLGSVAAPELMSSTRYPNPAFTRLTYQLSALLWRSCHDGTRLSAANAAALVDFDADFAAAVPGFPRYPA